MRLKRFSLKTLLLVVTAFALTMGPIAGWYAQMRETQKKQAMRAVLMEWVSAVGYRDGHVVELCLASNVVDPSDRRLANLRYFPRLRTLYMSNNRITDEGLQSVGNLAFLKSLTLSKTDVSDDGMIHLMALRMLEELNLFDTNLTDDAIVYLVCLKSLRWLNVAQTEITDKGLARLKARLPDCQVIY